MNIAYKNGNTGYLVAYDFSDAPARDGKSLGEVDIFGTDAFQWTFKPPHGAEFETGQCPTFHEALNELHGRILRAYSDKSGTWAS